jgi:light-harvesting complex I chlorophyll a/b binding protein 2
MAAVVAAHSAVVAAVATVPRSTFAGKSLRQATPSFCAPATKSAAITAEVADKPLWLPGSSSPEWLDGSLPGDYGFDPLGLGSDPELLKWFVQAELQNARWAMLGAAGIAIPEFLTSIGVLNTPFWFEAGKYEYFTDAPTLFAVQLLLMGWAEARRYADIINPGSVNVDPIFKNNKLTGTDVGYPGGLWFDPLGYGSGDEKKVRKARAKELANGRLAMVAFLGFWVQAVVTHQRPFENLFSHLADPGHNTIFSTLGQ